MIRPGPLNAITDVPGILVGNARAPDRPTGVSVVLPDEPAVAAVDVRGGGPGTRETEALAPASTVQVVHAVVLSGGSAFGLEAAAGAMAWLAERGRGLSVGGACVPIVPAAILFDLPLAGMPPEGGLLWRSLGQEAAGAAGRRFALGNAGAGTGARAGAYKGGLGTASFTDGAVTVGALVAANPMGSVVMPGTRSFWAWWLEQAGEIGNQRPPTAAPADLDHSFAGLPGAHTSLAVVATDAALSRAQAQRVALMAHDGLARAIRPVHSPLDGDTVFVLSTGRLALPDPVAGLGRLGMLAADCVSRAVMRGVWEAQALGGLPALRDGGNP